MGFAEKDYWWFFATGTLMIFPVALGLFIPLPLIEMALGEGAGLLYQEFILVVIFAMIAFCPIGVYLDRQYISKVAEWTPSRIYYFTFLGLAGSVLSVVYLYQRRKYVTVD